VQGVTALRATAINDQTKKHPKIASRFWGVFNELPPWVNAGFRDYSRLADAAATDDGHAAAV
jgi:hypothetical protein